MQLLETFYEDSASQYFGVHRLHSDVKRSWSGTREAHDTREMKSRAFYKALWIATNVVVRVSLLTYTYSRTAHVRRPFPLRPVLRSVYPGWDEAINWTLILERRSLAFTFLAAALFCFSLLARFGLGWHLEKHLRVPRCHLRNQALRVVQVLFTRPR